MGMARAASSCASEVGVSSKIRSSVSSCLRSKLGDGRLDQRRGEARQRRRQAAQNPLVEHGRLGKVGDLRRSADDQPKWKAENPERPAAAAPRARCAPAPHPECPPDPPSNSSAGRPATSRPAPPRWVRTASAPAARRCCSSIRKSRLDCGADGHLRVIARRLQARRCVPTSAACSSSARSMPARSTGAPRR